MWAYNLPAQIIAPDWINDIQLDIVAKAGTPAGDKQLYLMLRTLRTDRMGLKAHFEKREIAVYALTVAKGEPRFSESTTDGPMVSGQDKRVLVIQRLSITELAAELGRGMFDRPVVDRTGLTGRYDIRADMASVRATNQADRTDAADAMMAALDQQMGLKLENRKDRSDVLIIDHADETPAEN
jgi:uncharacterized protein (TIGR03435 family)